MLGLSRPNPATICPPATWFSVARALGRHSAAAPSPHWTPGKSQQTARPPPLLPPSPSKHRAGLELRIRLFSAPILFPAQDSFFPRALLHPPPLEEGPMVTNFDARHILSSTHRPPY